MELIGEPWSEYIPSNKRKRRLGKFKCPKCKKEVVKLLGNGKRAETCGCGMHDFKMRHGHSIRGKTTRLYSIWQGMKQRCYDVNSTKYYCYGKRGIVVCDEWKDNFTPFKDWALLNGYAKNLQIDRIDNDDNYGPSNCRFVTLLENMRNRGWNKLSMEKANEIREMYSTGNYSRIEIAKIYNVNKSTIARVIRNVTWA